MLKNKKILLGVCGSIAAYKSAFLIRLLTKLGAEVKVIMTQDAQQFITPLTLSTLSKNPVLTTFLQDSKSGVWNNHVALSEWADILLIAPASANTIAKMAHGICDNFLLACYLSAKCKVYIAPAMDLDMYQHYATQKNLTLLQKEQNVTIIPVGDGELASGLEGPGRMAEPQEIIKFLSQHIKKKTKNHNLAGKNILISAGPTQEAIDPIRYISNHSSGKMGIALANQLAEDGANVSLVLGPISANIVISSAVKQTHVTSAKEMYEQCIKVFSDCDIAIMAAAVADYSYAKPKKDKIKKCNDNLSLDLVKTKDILAELGRKKTKDQLLVGFALETNDEMNNAKRKLQSKNADIIILNSMNGQNTAFQKDTNKITILDKHNNIKNYELKDKKEVAKDITSYISNFI